MSNYWGPEGFHQLGQGEYAGITAVDVLRRMNEATGTHSRCELADWLGERQSFLTDAIRRNIIPARWLRPLVLQGTRLAPEWVLTGQENEGRGVRVCAPFPIHVDIPFPSFYRAA